MMKLGTMFEIGSCQLETKSSGMKNQIFNIPWPLPLQSFYMHQCPDPESTGWKWGQLLYRIAENVLIDSGILSKDYTLKHDPGYENLKPTKNHPEVRPYGITCFGDIYFSQRNGVWINKAESLIGLRASSARLIGEPAGALVEQESEEDSQPMQRRPTYCPPRHKQRKSSARIHIFQRTATAMLRSFINLDEGKSMTQMFLAQAFPITLVQS